MCCETTYADDEKVIMSYYFDGPRPGYDDDDRNETILAIHNEYLKEDSEGVEHVQDMSHYIERARALADTPFRVAHTNSACKTAECIMATDGEFNPSRTESGHRTFFG